MPTAQLRDPQSWQRAPAVFAHFFGDHARWHARADGLPRPQAMLGSKGRLYHAERSWVGWAPGRMGVQKRHTSLKNQLLYVSLPKPKARLRVHPKSKATLPDAPSCRGRCCGKGPQGGKAQHQPIFQIPDLGVLAAHSSLLDTAACALPHLVAQGFEPERIVFAIATN